MPAPAERQAAFIANPSATTNSYSCTMSSAVLAGDLLFMVSGSGVSTNALVVSDNVNGSWTRIGNQVSNGTHSMGIFYFQGSAAAAAGTLVITVSNGGGSNFGCISGAWEYTGIKTSSALRNFGQAGAAGTTSGTGTTPNGVSSLNDGDFIIVAIGNSSTNSPTYAAGALTGCTGTLTIRNPIANANAGAEDGVATSAGTTVTATATSAAITWQMGIQAFISAGWQITGNAGVAGATVSWTGAGSGSVVADGSGNYTIPNLISGAYTITPTLLGWTFSPTSSSQTVGHADISAVNFTATQSQVATPTFSPVAGTYTSVQMVSILDTNSGLGGFAITYTTDGSTPVPGSHGTVYTTPVSVGASLTLKAVASATGFANSNVGSAAYVINLSPEAERNPVAVIRTESFKSARFGGSGRMGTRR